MRSLSHQSPAVRQQFVTDPQKKSGLCGSRFIEYLHGKQWHLTLMFVLWYVRKLHNYRVSSGLLTAWISFSMT